MIRAPRLRAVALSVLAVAAFPARPSAHGIYSGLRNPVTGATCCNDIDCAPVPTSRVRLVPGGVSIDGFFMPNEELQDGPDQDWHACIWGGRVRCVLKPRLGF